MFKVTPRWIQNKIMHSNDHWIFLIFFASTIQLFQFKMFLTLYTCVQYINLRINVAVLQAVECKYTCGIIG